MVTLSRLISGLCFMTLFGCMPSGDDPSLPVDRAAVYGPTIIFDPLAKPTPELPFPNDLILTSNSETASGASWNVSTRKETQHESHLRGLLNGVDGFGPYAPITVSFDGPIDLNTVNRSSIVVVNIEPGHPREGEIAPLDLGMGYFPRAGQRHPYHGHDPYAEVDSLIFPDTNRVDIDGDGEAELVGHYEVASHTLIIRPIVPLAQNARHAVLLTTELFGQSSEGTVGQIRSPFDYKSHYAQMPFIEKALALTGLAPEALAFGWTYKTANIVGPFQRLRDGLYGRGALAKLNDAVSSEITEIRDTSITHDADGVEFPVDPRDHRYILQAEFLSQILAILGNIQDDDNFMMDFKYVDYLVFGSWKTPNIRMNERRELSLNLATGQGDIGIEDVPFMLAVPKTTDRFRPPFPVMLYFHGTGTSRFEPIAIADAMARQGIAVLAFDQVGHGPLIQDIPRLLAENPDTADLLPTLIPVIAALLVPDQVDEFYDLDVLEALEKLNEVCLFAELAVHGRAEDYNQDGQLDIAEAFFHGDPFRLCASFTQDILDMMQMVKVIRGLSQDKVPSEPLANPKDASFEELKPYLFSGDFNADGILDVGGPNVALSLAGTSLGGIHSVLGAAMEPEIRTVTPIVAGAGLADIMTRSGLDFILEPIFEEVLGNLVVGCERDGRLYITQGNEANRCRRPKASAMADVTAPAVGTPVLLTNKVNGMTNRSEVNEDGGFALTIDSDRGDELEIMIGPEAAPLLKTSFPAHYDGSGYTRNTAEFRRAITIQQHAFDLCDPSNFAPHLFKDPLPSHDPTNVLFMNAIGDDTVPVASSITLAIAAGVFGSNEDTWGPVTRWLIEKGVLLNELYDVHDILGNNPDEQPPYGLFTPIATATGVSSIRLADVNGKHEWIAGYQKDDFEFGRYSQNQIAIYHACGGRIILDGPTECIGSEDCALLDNLESIDGCDHVGIRR
ncbi:MAG: hypothetical protein VYA30_06325 [Myxococcota bacterium]|nr:hypothetical protein [Myxococcota bacterium]